MQSLEFGALRRRLKLEGSVAIDHPPMGLGMKDEASLVICVDELAHVEECHRYTDMHAATQQYIVMRA